MAPSLSVGLTPVACLLSSLTVASLVQVYWGNGCQIIPPHDAGIAAAIEANQALWQLPEQLPEQLVYDPTQQIVDSYYIKLQQHLHFCSNAENAAAARVVYTPLHGVGGKFVLQAFQVRAERGAGGGGGARGA